MIRIFCFSPLVHSAVAFRCICPSVSRSEKTAWSRDCLALSTSRRRWDTLGGLAVRADLYQVLHVSPTASKAQISASYRRLARKYHPDVNASEEASTQYGVSTTYGAMHAGT